MNRQEILDWLREEDPDRLEHLWSRADEVRKEQVGDEVHLRGLIEFSNHCVRHCAYCGLRAPNRSVRRYRMSAGEIMDCVRRAENLGFGTVVLQSGEDHAVYAEWVAALIHRIKSETRLAVTLSLGERSERELAVWRQAGADRYLLRFESSNPDLYSRVHPPLPGRRPDRLALLQLLRRLRYQTGSGMLIGLPGQTCHDLARDIELLGELDPDMIGAGPYIPHPHTPLWKRREKPWAPVGQQVPANEAMTFKVLALTRLVCPRANIPATTALLTLSPRHGLELGLRRGANVLMPDLTPPEYRLHYEIYPDRANLLMQGENDGGDLAGRILSMGRTPGRGRGDPPVRGFIRSRACPADA